MATNEQAKQVQAPATLRVLGKDEKLNRKREVFGPNRDKVKATFGIEWNKKTYVVEDCIFNFASCSPEEIMLLAMRGVVIATQSRAKVAMHSNLEGAIQASNWKVVNVKDDIIDSERRPASDAEKAMKLVNKLSDADRAALLAMLGATKK